MSTQAHLGEKVPGVMTLSGLLDHQTTVALRQEGQRYIQQSSTDVIVIDCAGVERSNSAGLSLLLSFQRDVLQAGKKLEVWNLPADMKQIASVSGLLDILPLSH
ncbi:MULTISPECIES: STAS domain-containing protein [Pseudomonas]|uniref:STAS domain-containing protein n=1 Tax=Pseudomonas TaxID=286 RepID=UPI002898D152|nr:MULTISPECIES: STAS domain-containing protein [Pseudomonas]